MRVFTRATGPFRHQLHCKSYSNRNMDHKWRNNRKYDLNEIPRVSYCCIARVQERKRRFPFTRLILISERMFHFRERTMLNQVKNEFNMQIEFVAK